MLYYFCHFKNNLNASKLFLKQIFNSKIIRCTLSMTYHFTPRVMVKVMDCGIVAREFVLQSRYYVHFRANTLRKDMIHLILPAMG